MRNIDNMEDVLDTRDIKERIEELESNRELALDNELETLQKLYQDCLDCSTDTKYGETLIRYSYFSDYVNELCEDCGYISKDFPCWIEIDWDATAQNVKQDYSVVDFDGIDYYIRSC